MKTLAICIPTYRRPQLLERCIESAVSSAQGRSIRIFVADDSASDINAATLERLCRKYAFVTWSRNPANLGIDRNIQHAVSLSNCDYAWLIGEDDLFAAGGVAHVHGLIQDCSAGFVFSNYTFVNEDFSRVVGTALDPGIDGYVDASSFVASRLWAVGFIGSTVVARAAWQRTVAEPYDGTYFTHVGRVVEIAGIERTLFVSHWPAIMNRSQGADTFTWKSDAFGVFFGFERMCRVAGERLPALASQLRDAVTAYRRQAGYLSLKTVLRLRAQGAFDHRQHRLYVQTAALGRWHKRWLGVVARLPVTLLRPLAVLHARLADRRRQAVPAPSVR